MTISLFALVESESRTEAPNVGEAVRVGRRARGALLALVVGLAVVGCRGGASSRDGGPSVSEQRAAKLAPSLALAEGDDTKGVTSTAAESRAHAPAWAERDAYAPSLEGHLADEIVTRARRDGAVLPASGLLACSVGVTSRIKSGLSGIIGIRSTPMLSVEIDLGKEKFRATATVASQTVGISVPLVSLDASSAVSVAIDLMAEGTVKESARIRLAATPRGTFEGAHEGGTVTCAILPREEVEKRFRDALPEATDALADAATDGDLVQPAHGGFGRVPLLATIVAKTSFLAAHVGWADPRVVRRTEWSTRMLAHHGKRVLELLAAAPAADTLPAFGRFASAQNAAPCGKEELAAVSAYGKERTNAGCAFRVSLTREPASVDLRADTFFHRLDPVLEADIVFADGEVVVSKDITPEGNVARRAESSAEVVLPRGENGAFHFWIRGDLANKAVPYAIVLRSSTGWVSLPYHAATDVTRDR